MRALGRERQTAYREARPYPHVVSTGCSATHAPRIARASRRRTHPGWKRRDYAEQSARLGQLQRTGFEGVAAEVRWLLAELNGMAFLDFLGALTGRRDLDRRIRTSPGPACSRRCPGGHLAVHCRLQSR